TPAGAVFVGEARRLLQSLDRAVEAARRAARGEEGVLRLAYVPATLTGLPEIVRRFRQRRPRVQVRMHEAPPAGQMEARLDGAIDVGFARGPIHEPALEVEVVSEEPLLAALPHGHRLGSRKSLRLALLSQEPFILQSRSRGPGFHDRVLAICQE